jgi:hypothetical protein
MIPRYQRILFWSLIGGIALMAAFLLHGCQQAHKRLTALNDATPIAAPTTASTEEVNLYLANDAEATITSTRDQVALPQDPTLRARALLEHLLAQYSQPNSTHPLQPGPAIDDVFLLTNPNPSNPGQLAVINFRSAFVDNHPSGILTENLTIQSIIGTLHAAFPQITQIRFLVDGQPRDTLAGHADLHASYPSTDTTTKPVQPTEEATQP